MQFVYAAVWLIMALLLIFRLGRENRVFYAAGGLFLVFAVWWLIDAIRPELKIFSGTTGWIFRGLIAVVLVLACIVFLRERRKRKDESGS